MDRARHRQQTEVTGHEGGEALLAALQAGEAEAAVALFERLQPPLLRYLRWQEPRAAEDLAGETWLAVAERIHAFTGDEADLRAFVFAIARRRLADFRRREARRRTRPVDAEALGDLPAGADPADVVTERLSADEAVARLVEELSPDQAEIVVLRVLGGFSVDEVASMLGKRAGAVRVAQHRALRRLARRTSADDLPRRGVTP